MPRLTRRTQVLLDEQRYQRLRARAAAERTSVGALVRDAVDRVLEGDDSGMASAEAFLSATPLCVGEPEELGEELESALARDRL
jgi:plasmid stability protein